MKVPIESDEDEVDPSMEESNSSGSRPSATTSTNGSSRTRTSCSSEWNVDRSDILRLAKHHDPECVIVNDWDDGHIPEHCQGIPTTLIWRPNSCWHSTSRVHVQDDALPPELVDAIYGYTVKEEGRPWGTYVTMKQLRPLLVELSRQQPPTARDGIDNSKKYQKPSASMMLDYQQHMALNACAWYLHHAQNASFLPREQDVAFNDVHNGGGGAAAGDNVGDNVGGDIRDFHGIAVWALPAQVGSQVPYHVDYAEQVRYQHNVLVLPLLAGTLHCTRNNNNNAGGGSGEQEGEEKNDSQKESPSMQQDEVQGGALQIFGNNKPSSSNGLEHYEKHGYKACKCPIEKNVSDQANNNNNVTTIAYSYNRLIIMSGQLPHASTTIVSLPANKQRVILGFNVFGHDVGDLVEAAPEHSAKWRRKTKLLHLEKQILLHAATAASGPPLPPTTTNMKKQQEQHDHYQQHHDPSSSAHPLVVMPQKLTLASVEQNPALRKLLVQAKRQRVKEEWRRQYLDEQVVHELQQEQQQQQEGSTPIIAPSCSITVAQLIKQILEKIRGGPNSSSSSLSWPTTHDILEHLKCNTSSTTPNNKNRNDHKGMVVVGSRHYYQIDDEPVTLESTIRLVPF